METLLQILQWAIPSGGIGAAIAWLANRKVASAKAKKAIHDTYKAMYEDISQLLVENQKKNEKTINSLQEELDKARTESARIKRSLDRLSRAIEAIQYCPHRGTCPISHELQVEANAGAKRSSKRLPPSRKQLPTKQLATDADNDGSAEDSGGHGDADAADAELAEPAR